jgi:hypothetical protein
VFNVTTSTPTLVGSSRRKVVGFVAPTRSPRDEQPEVRIV